MKINVYSKFENWFKNGAVWIYSDPHFADEEMQYLRQNYIGDEEQVKRINKVVGKKDTLIILGDIGDVSFVKQLKGYKVLITGNHDKGASYYFEYFDEVYNGPLFISAKLLLSHEPIHYPYALNIHGHDHSQWFPQDNNHINLCAELIDYTPINFATIIKSGKLSKIDDIHRATIDRATNGVVAELVNCGGLENR